MFCPRQTRSAWCSALLTSVLIINFCAYLLCQPVTALSRSSNAYYDINVELDESENMPKDQCQDILADLEKTLTASSASLYEALDGHYYFGSFNIFLPPSWDDACIPSLQLSEKESNSNKTEHHRSKSSPHAHRKALASTGGKSDITITGTHAVFGDNMWTSQYGGCGAPGKQIYVPFKSLSNAVSAKQLVKDWAKYRYGVFDEIGFRDDPIYTPCYYSSNRWHITGCSDQEIDNIQDCSNGNPFIDFMRLAISKNARTSLMFASQAPNVVMFCDMGNHNRYAPTKHNYLCDRQSTLDVILRHADFRDESLQEIPSPTYDSNDRLASTHPTFNYRRRRCTRYIVIIDDSMDISQRESWSFLRNAFRKWVIYDLMSNNEIGVILANGKAVGKSLDLTPLSNNTNRDLVASFLPYAPADSRQPTCIKCAVKRALHMLEQRRLRFGNASHVLLIIAPGMDHGTNVPEIAEMVANTPIATINYPAVISREPLDLLATASGGISFSVQEQKFNSEKSYLTTYVRLTNALMYISGFFYEGHKGILPIEIHRNEVYDASSDASTLQRSTQQVYGEFFLEPQFSLPAGFYIYTHSTEAPLIQAMRLAAPSGKSYSTRSDQRMPVKQITLLAPLNETGMWRYEIERYPGNPQPHVIQVMATPVHKQAFAYIQTETWAVQKGNFFMLYCAVKRGQYPVLDALVRVLVKYHDSINNVETERLLDLKDLGASDADIMRGDGIYGSNLRVEGAGVYSFDFHVRGINGSTYTIRSYEQTGDALNLQCCGNEMAPMARHEAASKTAESAKRFKYTELTGPFERYGPPLTYFVERTELPQITSQPESGTDATSETDNITFGNHIVSRILDFSCERTVTLLNFKWTNPLDIRETHFEIRYAYSIEDIVDKLDRMPLLAVLNVSSPLAYGVGLNYSYDSTQTPEMENKVVFFALRTQNSSNYTESLSNIVQLSIPAKAHAAPTDVPHPPAFPTALNDGANNGESTASPGVGEDTVTSIGIGQVKIVRYAIPLVLALIMLLLLLCLACYVMRCRRRSHTAEDRSKINTCSDSPQDLSPSHMLSSTIHAPTDGLNTSFLNGYSASDIGHHQPADHHTVGIPIYDDDVISKKRLSTCGPQGYTIEDLKVPAFGHCPLHTNGSAIVPNNYNINCNLPPYYNGVSIISSSESWSATQLLREHQRRSSPQVTEMSDAKAQFDGLSLESGGIPPVPPLPMPLAANHQYPKTAAGAFEYGYHHIQQQHPSVTTTDTGTAYNAINCGGGSCDMDPELMSMNLSAEAMGARDVLHMPHDLQLSSPAFNNGFPPPPLDKQRRRNVTMV